MNLKLIDVGNESVAEVSDDGLVIKSVQDALELLATASYEQGATCVLLREQHLLPEFFELQTGLAGEILQKYTNYRMKLVIVGNFSGVQSNSLKAFILESNRGQQVAFMPTRAAALGHIASW